jgi:DNA invertase Pin-like site-specific DNA recombinase
VCSGGSQFFAVCGKVGSNPLMLVGYVRTTREGAIPAAEDASLRDAGCEVVFADACAGAAAEQQPELGKALDSLGPQDVLLVTGLDRLAGGLRELIARMVQVQAKGASVRTLQGAIEPGATKGKELLDALLSFDQQIAEARSLQKMNAAQAGRPRLLDDAAVRLAASRAHAGEPVPKIARSIGVSARKLRQALDAETASAKREKLRS